MSEIHHFGDDPEEPNPSIIDFRMRELMVRDNQLAADAKADDARAETKAVAFEKLAETLSKTIQLGLEKNGKYLGFLTGDSDYGFEYERKELQEILPDADLDLDLAVIAEATMCAVQNIISSKVSLAKDFDPDVFISVHLGDDENSENPSGMIISISTNEQ